MPQPRNVLLVAPRFNGHSFWNFAAACELYGARFPSAPLGLITVAALLPILGMPPGQPQHRGADRGGYRLGRHGDDRRHAAATTRHASGHRIVHARGKPVVVGGPDVTSSPDSYASADFRVLGEAEGIIGEFVAAWESGIRQGVFEAPKFTIDVTKTPIPRFDLLQRGQYLYFGVQFSRGCPFTVRVLRHHRTLRPRAAHEDDRPDARRARYALSRRLSRSCRFRRRQFHRQQEGGESLLPHLIAWQKERGYPFEFSTEASINLADDDALLGLMREANFFTVFVGIESPDTETLVAMQKKQNTRRSLPTACTRSIGPGMFVNAGFIVGFDSEKGSVAEAMIALH